jgi:hypothetical protein
MSQVNVGAELVKQNGGLSYTDEKLVEMSNGCLCCTLRDDLPEEVPHLAERKRFDYLVTGQMLRCARESAAAFVEQPTQTSVTDWSQNQIFEFSILSPRLTGRPGGIGLHMGEG